MPFFHQKKGSFPYFLIFPNRIKPLFLKPFPVGIVLFMTRVFKNLN
jgi:hypothetical protein